MVVYIVALVVEVVVAMAMITVVWRVVVEEEIVELMQTLMNSITIYK